MTQMLDRWPEVFASRQSRKILEEMAVGIEEHNLYEETIPCLRVNIGNIKGLIPLKESGAENKDGLRRLVGQKLPFIVIGIMEDDNLCICSRIEAVKRLEARTWKELKEGQTRQGRVAEVKFRRAVIDIDGVKADMYASEYDWGWNNDLRDKLKVNETLEVKVLSIDRENHKVTVSRKALLPDPWPAIMQKYKIGDEIIGRVTGVEKFGIFINLEPGIDALTPHMVNDIPAVGEHLFVRITDINQEKRQINARVIRKLNIAG